MGNSSSDYFNGNVTFLQKGAGVLYPAYNASTYFGGNLTVDGSSAIIFGSNGGKAIFNGTTSQSINKSSSYAPLFKKLTINKSSGTLTLNSPVTISDSLVLTKGIINSDSANVISISDNGKTSGGSDSSFVNGPLTKIGNDAFIFPLGSNIVIYGKYHPLGISAPSSISDQYTGEYNYGYHNKINTVDSIKISYTEFWILCRTVGATSVDVTLGWNANSSEVWDTSKVYVVRHDGSHWINLGGKNRSKNNSVGSVVSNTSVNLNNSVTNIFTVAGLLDRIKPSVDSFPYRGLYVNKFLSIDGAGKIKPNKTILGIATKENELLQFAKDNNFKYLKTYSHINLYKESYLLKALFDLKVLRQ